MSDNCLHIVPVHSGDYPDADQKRHQIIDWFVSRGFVEAESSDCVLGEGPGYRFLPAIEQLFLPSPAGSWFSKELWAFGMEVHAGEKRVFHPMEGAELSLICAECGRSHDFDEATSFIPGWFDGSDENPSCLGCGNRQHLAEWACVPAWGFSNLGVTFWNSHWDPAPDFLKQMRALMGAEIRVVLARL